MKSPYTPKRIANDEINVRNVLVAQGVLSFNRAGAQTLASSMCILDYIAYAVDTRAYGVRVYLKQKRTETSRKCAPNGAIQPIKPSPGTQVCLEISQGFTA